MPKKAYLSNHLAYLWDLLTDEFLTKAWQYILMF